MEDIYRIEVVKSTGGKNFRMSEIARAILEADYKDVSTAEFGIKALKSGNYKKWTFRIVKQLSLI